MTKLTKDNVRTLPAGKGGDTLYRDAEGKDCVPRLYLRVRDNGQRTFMIRWRTGPHQRKQIIGEVGILSLEEARVRARKLLVEIGDGIDPAAVKARAKVSGQQIFLPLAERYLSYRAKDMKPLSLDQITRHLKLYWKPLHRLQVSKIDRFTIAAELQKLIAERGPIAADRARSTLSTFFGWLIGEGLVDANPVSGTNKSGAAKDRDRVLTDNELAAIWNASDPETDYGRIVRLLLLTGQRRDEIADLQWSEVDLEGRQISLPSTRTKNGRPHDVPLSALATGVLLATTRRGNRQYVFGEGGSGYSGFSRAKNRLDKRCGVTGWTLHDLRRTMATRMADLGVEPHVIEAILNHVSGHKRGVAGIYNRSTYAKQKRDALDLWADHVQTIAAKSEGANVISMRRKGA